MFKWVCNHCGRVNYNVRTCRCGCTYGKSSAGACDMDERKRVCCNCGNNLRIKDEQNMVTHCECAIDGHYIGYIECFEHWCRRWRKDRTWDGQDEPIE